MSQSSSPSINQLLAALPSSEFQQLEPYLEPIFLEAGQVLCEPKEPMNVAYFPGRAAISLVSLLEDGSTTEIGLIGNEGMVGLPIFLGGKSFPNRAIVQIRGSALKLDGEILKREFHRGGKLQQRLLLYTQALLTQVSQSAACNRQHTTEERLARWLLSVRDCVLSDELPLTQEFIANMLGIRRSGVTVAAGILQQAGTIEYRRGQITIRDREDLESISCECYRLVQSEFLRLLGSRRG
ncbi:MAG TPA: Crp/Fnr family transcriptional regulator [Oscillatoriales cyanobacterium M59_W2019_021]|nr:MAG: Crp/Fnr family transcriptional regulator [Cyanobacteria bacterium J055]HIK29987.1 Crp/Fnr family transcriptional regulator [Oscillatoriales cyanobacterium M4454_W2019_049]HIK49970.1 Crp/Fnr family transcriptional regulator [Oscillatoriales cyanobacterium M59_W2019_021]